ncbi:rhodanese-like domain-containing protein [Bacillaceae bacterium]
MKKTIIGLTIVAIVVVMAGWYWLNTSASGSSAEKAAASTWEKIDQEQMLQEMEKEDVTIVDLREPELYAKGHIPGAINIPFAEFQNRYQELDKEKRIIFVCHTGPMGDASSQFLLEKGYKNLANLKGGMAGWTGPLATK